MLPEEDIGTEVITSSNLSAEVFTETYTFIADQETFYLVYLYWGMAMLSFVLFMLGHIKTKQKEDSRF